jgi:hypothetical protein
LSLTGKDQVEGYGILADVSRLSGSLNGFAVERYAPWHAYPALQDITDCINNVCCRQNFTHPQQ